MDTLTTYFRSLDEMPIYNWFKCHEGNFEYTVKSGEVTDINGCVKAFENLYDQYLKIIGVGDKYSFFLKSQKELVIANCDYVITRNRKILNKIDQIEARIKNMEMSNGSTERPEVILMHLGKWLGFHVNQKETTVVEYFTWIDQYKKQAKPTK